MPFLKSRHAERCTTHGGIIIVLLFSEYDFTAIAVLEAADHFLDLGGGQ